jgi:hypothetical protein
VFSQIQPEGQYRSVDERREQVPKHMRGVSDQRMPGWAVTTSQVAAITGSVADLDAAQALMADVEAVTGSRFAAARTRNSGDRLIFGHMCKRAVDLVQAYVQDMQLQRSSGPFYQLSLWDLAGLRQEASGGGCWWQWRAASGGECGG